MDGFAGCTAVLVVFGFASNKCEAVILTGRQDGGWTKQTWYHMERHWPPPTPHGALVRVRDFLVKFQDDALIAGKGGRGRFLGKG
jgi:hypothetical protein